MLYEKGGYWYHDAIMFTGISTQIPGIPKGQMKWLKVHLLIAKEQLPRH